MKKRKLEKGQRGFFRAIDLIPLRLKPDYFQTSLNISLS